jgi:hypothetical protein
VFGLPLVVTVTKTFSIDAVFRYEVKLPLMIGLNGEIVVPLKRRVFVGNN